MKSYVQELLAVEVVSEFLEELVLGVGAVEVPGDVGERNGALSWHGGLLWGTR